MEEVKLGEEGKELGASAAIDDEAAEGEIDWVNQSDKVEEKGIWGLVRVES